MGAIAEVLAQMSRTDERGQTLTEYALIIAFVVILLVGAIGLFRSELIEIYQSIGTQVASAGS